MGYFFGALLLLLVVGSILGTLYQVIALLARYWFDDYFNLHLIFTRIKPEYLNVLKKEFPFYRTLNKRDRKIFRRRVQKFIDLKSFEPRGEIREITPQMKALIAASAIQITFGFPSVYFDLFDTIIVYPEAFYSTTNNEYHRGEVNTHGYIVLSWNNFYQGYLNPRDGRNLGLHEMAHALKVSDLRTGRDQNLFDPDAFHEFIYHARLQMHRIAEGDESFFRAYAATNDEEFFAVAVENFFERPQTFQTKNPRLYKALANLLNQDPLAARKSD